MKQRKIKPGLYRHVNGGMYRVLSTATHTENGGRLVIYRDEKSGKVLAQPYEMFAAPVDREQYHNAEQKAPALLSEVCDDVCRFAREEGSMDDLEALCMGCPVNKLVELVGVL